MSDIRKNILAKAAEIESSSEYALNPHSNWKHVVSKSDIHTKLNVAYSANRFRLIDTGCDKKHAARIVFYLVITLEQLTDAITPAFNKLLNAEINYVTYMRMVADGIFNLVGPVTLEYTRTHTRYEWPVSRNIVLAASATNNLYSSENFNIVTLTDNINYDYKTKKCICNANTDPNKVLGAITFVTYYDDIQSMMTALDVLKDHNINSSYKNIVLSNVAYFATDEIREAKKQNKHILKTTRKSKGAKYITKISITDNLHDNATTLGSLIERIDGVRLASSLKNYTENKWLVDGTVSVYCDTEEHMNKFITYVNMALACDCKIVTKEIYYV